MLSKHNRLSKDIYNTVFKTGKTHQSPLFMMKYVTNGVEKRYSVVVSKKVLKYAYQRNNLRRFVYDIVRENIDILKPGLGIFIIKKEFTQATLQDLKRDVLHALHKTIGFEE